MSEHIYDNLSAKSRTDNNQMQQSIRDMFDHATGGQDIEYDNKENMMECSQNSSSILDKFKATLQF